jgi:outer membrane biosynthesis protein TonB
MRLRFFLLFALGTVLLTAQEQKHVPTCCEPESAKLSQAQTKALVKKTAPINAPCCADMLHINGAIVLEISVDTGGDVTCVQTVSGHPLLIGVAIDSLKRWKFQPYSSKGTQRSFCGQVALRFRANEHGVKYKIL